MADYPYDWYWLADDGRVFASARQVQVDTSDSDYQAFIQLQMPTPWPRDGAGNQTDNALQEVIAPYGMFANLVFYAESVSTNKADGGVIVTSLSPIMFLTDQVSRNSINSAWNYATQKGVSYTVQWKMSDGSFITLTEANLTTLANDVVDFVTQCVACEANAATDIGNGTVTTRAQIDAAFAAISNVYP